MNPDGKTILITGSTDGVGRLVARRVAVAGAHALIHERDRERGKGLADEINRAGRGEATFYRADFSSLAEVRRLADDVLHNHPRLEVLVNNAGLYDSRQDHRPESNRVQR